MKFVEIGRAMRRARGICQATYSTAAHRLGEHEPTIERQLTAFSTF